MRAERGRRATAPQPRRVMSPPEHSRLCSATDLGRMPNSEMLVRPYLAARQLTCLFGTGDTYKSFIALNWTCRLAHNDTPVIYIAAEGGEGMRGCVTAWMIHDDV